MHPRFMTRRAQRPARIPAILAVFAAAAFLCGGCDRLQRAPRAPQLDPQLEARVASLESQLAQERQANEQSAVDLRRQLSVAEQAGQACEAQLSALRDEVSTQLAQMESMSQTIERAKGYVTKLRSQLAAKTSERPDDEPLTASDFIIPPTGSLPDLFPIAMYGITTKISDPDRGAAPAGSRYQPVTVANPGYKVSFSARNLTKSTRAISVDAGKGALRLFIGPGRSLENQLIAAEPDAPLTVTVAGQTRSFTVSR